MGSTSIILTDDTQTDDTQKFEIDKKLLMHSQTLQELLTKNANTEEILINRGDKVTFQDLYEVLWLINLLKDKEDCDMALSNMVKKDLIEFAKMGSNLKIPQLLEACIKEIINELDNNPSSEIIRKIDELNSSILPQIKEHFIHGYPKITVSTEKESIRIATHLLMHSQVLKSYLEKNDEAPITLNRELMGYLPLKDLVHVLTLIENNPNDNTELIKYINDQDHKKQFALAADYLYIPQLLEVTSRQMAEFESAVPFIKIDNNPASFQKNANQRSIADINNDIEEQLPEFLNDPENQEIAELWNSLLKELKEAGGEEALKNWHDVLLSNTDKEALELIFDSIDRVYN